MQEASASRLNEEQASDEMYVQGCSSLGGMRAIRSLHLGMHGLLVFSFEHETWRRVFAAFVAHDLLPAHGAEIRESVDETGTGKGAGETNRRILPDICRDTGCIACRRGDFMAHDA